MIESTHALGATLVGALVAAGITVPLSMRVAAKIGAIDQPGDLKIHDQPIPRLGGLGVYLAGLVVFIVAALVYGADLQSGLVATLIGTGLIAAVGFVDDVRGLPQTKKFVAEGCITAVCLFFLVDDMAWWIAPLCWVWLVGLLNAYNFIDGMDGLFAGTAAVNLLALGILFALEGMSLPALLALGFAGALLGFLRFNWQPARIFMGDGGALGIGFLIASLSVIYAGEGGFQLSRVAAVLLAAALPVGDVVFTLIRRLFLYRTLKPAVVFQGDRSHFYDQMQTNARMPVRKIVALSYGAAVLLSALGIYTRDMNMIETLGAGLIAVTGMVFAGVLCKVRIPKV